MTRMPWAGRALLGLAGLVLAMPGAAQPARSPAGEPTAPVAQRHRPPPIDRPGPSVEVVIPLDLPASNPCADQATNRSRAQVDGSERFELGTSGAVPPADLGC
jgi:hypothetical protein